MRAQPDAPASHAIGQVHGKIASHVQPGQMRILDEPVRFTIHDATVASA